MNVHTRYVSVARWSATAFLVAGGLLLATVLLEGMAALTGGSVPRTVTGVTSLGGVVLTYVALVGLYPRVTERSPRLARAAVALVGLPAAVLLVFLLWGAAGHSVAAVPTPVDVVPAVGAVFVAVFVLFALGTALFGVASHRDDRLPRAVGLLLFALAATWIARLGASTVYGSQFPGWFDALFTGLMAAVTLSLGYTLRGRPVSTAGAERSAPVSD